MVLHLNLDRDGRVYYTITCNRCQRPFVCFDDGCYSFASLRLEATLAGWQAGRRPDQPHHCPACVHR